MLAMVYWGLIVAGILLLKTFLSYLKALRTINHHPGLRSVLSKTSSMPRLWGLSPEKTVTWLEKHKIFDSHGWDIISSASVWPVASVAFFVADPDAIKEITGNRSRFPKLMTDYSVLSLFGPNIVASEGQQWKKYRRLIAPAYSQENIMAVWDETFLTIHDLCESWRGLESIPIENVVKLTFEIALRVISITGFGIPLKETVPSNHTLSFGDALHCVATDSFIKLAVPDWVPGVTRRVRRVRVAFKELRQYMEELVNAKEKGGEEFVREGSLLKGFVEASEAEGFGGVHLTPDEIFGNLFISFFAGHETTTHTIAFALLLLALHPHEQDLLYQQVRDVLSGTGIPPWSSKEKLTRASAVLNETLRMFPPLTGLPKYNLDSCVLSTCSASSTSRKRDVTVPQGATVIIDIPGLHYNHKYWKKPYEFRPDRFLEPWCEAALQPFSTGSRACLGRNFFEAEGIATLASLVSKYEIVLHPDHASLDLKALMQKVSDVKPGLTLCPNPLPLVFKKRTIV